MSEREDLEKILAEILTPLGIRAVRLHGQYVRVSPERDAFEIGLALPMRHVEVEIDRSHPGTAAFVDEVLKQLDYAQQKIFHDTIEHIAKHSRHPLDRMQAIEGAARTLLQALDVGLDDIRMPYGTSSKVTDAAWKLRELLRSKPGAVTWARNGYGPDPQSREMT